nr:MAG TPA: hypothetical protein [Caudoviricetes sp.]
MLYLNKIAIKEAIENPKANQLNPFGLFSSFIFSLLIL